MERQEKGYSGGPQLGQPLPKTQRSQRLCLMGWAWANLYPLPPVKGKRHWERDHGIFASRHSMTRERASIPNSCEPVNATRAWWCLPAMTGPPVLLKLAAGKGLSHFTWESQCVQPALVKPYAAFLPGRAPSVSSLPLKAAALTWDGQPTADPS